MTHAANRETEWLTPSGRLAFAEDGAIRALVRLNSTAKAGVLAAAQTAVGLQEAPFLAAEGFAHRAEGIELVWRPLGARRIPLANAAPAWRSEPAVHLPQALAVAQTVGRAASLLQGRRPGRFLLSPLQVLTGGGRGRQAFEVIVAPLDGADLDEIAAASEASLSWLPGGELAGAGADRSYLTGATLYYCLVDELYPPRLPLQQRILRMLLHRGGNASRAKAALTAATPASLAPIAAELATFIMALLSPEHGRPLTPIQAAGELDRFSAELSAPRLAAAWEAEGADLTALKILNAFEAIAAPNEIPWELLARLRAKTGDSAGEEDARRNIRQLQEERANPFIASLRKLIAEGPAGLPKLSEAAARLMQQAAAPLPDEDELFLIYVNARYLHNFDQSLKLLNRVYPVAWRRAEGAVLKARLLAEGRRWGDVSKACALGAKVIGEMPDRGSEPGRYALSYLQLLDGAAHIRAVQGGQAPDYLQDAFLRLQNAWTLSCEAGAAELQPHIASWMRALAAEARKTSRLAVLALGVEAFLQSSGGSGGLLTIPWFDDARLFT